jgi:hypothetical protein
MNMEKEVELQMENGSELMTCFQFKQTAISTETFL